jgi:hypothetical protein
LRKSLGVLDAKGDLKDVDHLFKGFGVRIALHPFPKCLEMVSCIGERIALENWVLTAVPNPLQLVKTGLQVKPPPSQRPFRDAS